MFVWCKSNGRLKFNVTSEWKKSCLDEFVVIQGEGARPLDVRCGAPLPLMLSFSFVVI